MTTCLVALAADKKYEVNTSQLPSAAFCLTYDVITREQSGKRRTETEVIFCITILDARYWILDTWNS